MTHTKNLLIALLVFLGFVTSKAWAQDTNISQSTLNLGVPEVSLLSSSSGIVNLSLSQRSAGLSIEPSKSDSTSRLLVSSVIASSLRKVTAKISSGSVPVGTVLKLAAKLPNTSFVGTAGTIGTEVALDGTDRQIITGIGTCYSGTTASTDGYPLKFTFALDSNTSSYGSLRATAGSQITVTLTLLSQ